MSTISFVILVSVAVWVFQSTRNDEGVTTPYTSSGGDVQPTAAVTVSRRDFSIRLSLDGETSESTNVVLSPHNGIVARVSSVSKAVKAGQPIGALEVSPRIASSAQLNATSSVTRSQMNSLALQTGPLEAPVSGMLKVEHGANIIVSQGFDVVVELSPLQSLRFRSARFTGVASVETVLGPRSVRCVAMWLEPAEDKLHCRVPAYAETVGGLRASLVIQSVTQPNVIVVPNLALTYDESSDGYQITVIDNGKSQTMPVDVGVTDGVARVVTSDLKVGLEILLPGDPSPGSITGDRSVPNPSAS